MVSPSRSTPPRRRRDDAGKLFIGVLVLLGLTASVFLIFSENVQYVRVGLVAALWAAVIGALAATRYRKDAAVDKAKVRDLQTVYELQLEREINARREYEMGVEARVRAEVGADASEIAALRAELAQLRQNLQVLFDGALPEEQPALQADAVRIDALPAGDFDAFDDADHDYSDSQVDANAAWFGPWQQPPSALKPVFMQPVSANFADPYDDPVTAETSAIQLDEYAEAQHFDPHPTPAPHPAAAMQQPPAAQPAQPAPTPSNGKTPPPRLSAPHTKKLDDTGAPLGPAINPTAAPSTAAPAETATPGQAPGTQTATPASAATFAGPANSASGAANSAGTANSAGAANSPSAANSAAPADSASGAANSTGAANSASGVATSASAAATPAADRPTPASDAGTQASAAQTSAPSTAAQSGTPEPTDDSATPSEPSGTAPTKPSGPTVGTSSRRRRRAEEEGAQRLSVADIMANLQSESSSRS
ncbi:DUF6779 domain-containing protein [Nocardia asteroides]|uniref:DUF6779 domain-containing protein n=1 Tax=Nocardia asteroides TaxID=1824 RepID=UPI00344422FD